MKAVSLVVVMTVGLLVCLSQQVLAASLTTADPQPTCPPGSICAYYTPPPPIRIFALGMCEEYTYEQMLNNEEQKCVNCYAQDGIGSCRCKGGQCPISGGVPNCSDECSKTEMKLLTEIMEEYQKSQED